MKDFVKKIIICSLYIYDV